MDYEEYYRNTSYLDQIRERSEQAALVQKAEDELGIREMREVGERFSEEVMRNQHVKLYGEIPSFGNSTIDALARVGCPCIQCFRSDFL